MKKKNNVRVILVLLVALIFTALLIFAGCSKKPTVTETASLTDSIYVAKDAVVALDYKDSAQQITVNDTKIKGAVEYLYKKIFNESSNLNVSLNNSADVSVTSSSAGIVVSAKRRGEFGASRINAEDNCLFKINLYFCDVKTVSTPEDLQSMDDPYTIYKLAGDIDMTGFDWTPYDFYGCLDGAGYSIKNFTYEGKAGQNNVGMFTNMKGKVQNISFSTPKVSVNGASKYVGIIAGRSSGSYEDVSIIGATLTAGDCDVVGALTGLQRGRATNVTVEADVSGSRAVGGVFGNVATTKYYKQTTINFSGSAKGYEWVGGIAGAASDFDSVTNTDIDLASFEGANNKGAVKGTYYVGGIVGYAVPYTYVTYTDEGKNGTKATTNVDRLDVKLTSVVNEGTVEGVDYVGGVVGAMGYEQDGYTMTGFAGECKNLSKICGTYYVGGIVGSAKGFWVENLENTVEVVGEAHVGGIAGYSTGVRNCTNSGKVTSTGEYYNGRGYVGGIAGYVGEVISCTNKGEVIGEKGMEIGGIAGFARKTVTTCTNEGFVTGTSRVGGIAGCIDSVTADGNVNKGRVIGSSESAGGVFGDARISTITNTVNEGAVNGKDNIGGVIGILYAGKVENAESKADEITGTGINTGGVIGKVADYEGSTPTLSTLYSSSSVSGFDYVGGVIGIIESSITVESLNTTAKDVKGKNYVGGIVGQALKATIKNAIIMNTAIKANHSVGGIVGIGYAVESSTFSGTIDLEEINASMKEVYVGGIAGQLDYAVNCVNYADITVPNGRYVGGIAGSILNTDENKSHTTTGCKNKGEITAHSYVGGIVGAANWANASECENEGAVSASSDYAGGIYGYAKNVKSITHSKNSAEISAYEGGNTANAGGIVGNSVSTSKITGCTNSAGVAGTNAGNLVAGSV